jgi:hypothetical protein
LESRALFSGEVAAAAAPVAFGQTVSGDISAPGETDEYTFTAAQGQRIFFDVQNVTGTYATLYLDFKLYRVPPGQAPVRIFFTTAYAGEPDGADEDVTTLDGGNYLLTVDARQDDLAGYQFKIWSVPAPDVKRINIGDEASGAIEAPGNTDEFLFTAAPGQRTFLDVLETTGTFATLYLDFTLYSVPASGPQTQVFKSTAYATRPDNGDYGPATLAGGEYRLVVDARDQDLSTYRFKLVNVPSADVNPVTFGAVKQGAIESPGSIDEWTFNVPTATRMFLDVQEVTGNHATLYLDFSLQKVDGTPVEKSKTTAYAGQPDIADAGPIALDPGNYKLVVTARGMDTSTYKFVLRREMALTVAGTAWAPSFVQALHDAGLGDAGYFNNPLETKTLPWLNINTAVAQLPPGLSIPPNEVVAKGTYVTRTPSQFTYDPVTGRASMQFAAPLPYDNYLVDIGSLYRTRLRLLGGDANRDNRVNSLDLAFVKQRLNRSIASPGTGNGAYSVFADGNGDARINALDLAAVKTNLNSVLPAGLAAIAVRAGWSELSNGETSGGVAALLAD